MIIRILTFMSGDWGHVFFGTLKFLKEKIDFENYVVIDRGSQTKEFFRSQNILKLKKIYFYRDYIKSVHIPDLDYLKTFEKKYKIDLWYVAYADPNFDRYEKPNRFNETEILSLLENDCRFYEEILQKINPNFLIIQTGNLKHLVLLELMCKSLGVKILKFGPARFGKNFQISRDYDLLDELKESRKNNTKLERMSDKDVEKLHHELDMSDIVYPRSGIGDPKLNQKNFVINFLTHYSKMKKAFLEIYANQNSSFIGSYFDGAKQKIRKISRKRFLDKYAHKEINNSTNFVYFPLNMQPEMTVSIYAPMYADQLSVIKNIARSLPIDYELYVKEHPGQGLFDYWRSISFYKEIIVLPNVKFIHPSVNSKNLLEKCKLIVNITGSTTYEAQFYHKPVLVFVDTASGKKIPSVVRVKSLEELPHLINRSLMTPYNDEGYKEYFDSKIKESFFVDRSIFSDAWKTFYINGVLIDEITVKKMNKFIKKHEKQLNLISGKFLKKINQHINNEIII